MNKDKQTPTDAEITDKLLKQMQEDAELEVRKQAIHLERAALSAQLRTAREQGDTALCEEIKHRKQQLLEALQKIR